MFYPWYAENNYARQKTVSDLTAWKVEIRLRAQSEATTKNEQEKSIKVKCMVRDLRRESFITCIYIIHKLAGLNRKSEEELETFHLFFSSKVKCKDFFCSSKVLNKSKNFAARRRKLFSFLGRLCCGCVGYSFYFYLLLKMSCSSSWSSSFNIFYWTTSTLLLLPHLHVLIKFALI